MASAEATSSTQVQTVLADQSAFRFFDLPPELRNVIYEMVVADITVKYPHAEDRRPASLPNVVEVSRKMTAEVTPLICRYSAFEFRVKVSIVGHKPLLCLRHADCCTHCRQEMDFRVVIILMQQLKGAARKALLANPRLTILIDYYSCSGASHDGLLEWLRYRNKHFRSRKPIVQWNYDVIEGALRRGPHDWQTGDWFLKRAGYYELFYLHDHSRDPYDRRTLSELLRAFWNFAHPEVSF